MCFEIKKIKTFFNFDFGERTLKKRNNCDKCFTRKGIWLYSHNIRLVWPSRTRVISHSEHMLKHVYLFPVAHLCRNWKKKSFFSHFSFTFYSWFYISQTSQVYRPKNYLQRFYLGLNERGENELIEKEIKRKAKSYQNLRRHSTRKSQSVEG